MCDNLLEFLHFFTYMIISFSLFSLKFYNFIQAAHFVLLSVKDVVSIPKTNESFRLLYDTKGRFRLHSLRDDEAKVCDTFGYVVLLLLFVIFFVFLNHALI